MAKFPRQIAKYLFAKEIKATNVQYVVEAEDSEFNSMHSVTPTGQDVGRVYICGTLTEVEDIGNDNPYYKGRLVDPTGAISIYAGNYQPDALKAMEEIVAPAHIAVIGKIAMFETEDGTKIPSVKPESITEIDEDTIRTWTFMTAKNLIEHIENTNKSKARVMAAEAYGDVRTEYKVMAMDALKSLLPQTDEKKGADNGAKD
ncbi:MAG: RPA family protein [Candidatus Thorarchaeota archaeon]